MFFTQNLRCISSEQSVRSKNKYKTPIKSHSIQYFIIILHKDRFPSNLKDCSFSDWKLFSTEQGLIITEIMQRRAVSLCKRPGDVDEILSNCTTVEIVVVKNVGGRLKICYRDLIY